MGIGKQVQAHKLNSSGGEYPKAGAFRGAKITTVADVTGKDKLQSLIVTFLVDRYTPGKNVLGVRYPKNTHTKGDLVKFHAKVRPDIQDTVINNIKNACLGFVKQLQADAGGDPNLITQDDITEEIVDEQIFCNNSRIVDLVMDFNVTEEYTRGTKADGSRGVVTKFTWLVRMPDGTEQEIEGTEAEEDEDENEEAKAEEETEDTTEEEEEEVPEPAPAPKAVAKIPTPAAPKGKGKKS